MNRITTWGIYALIAGATAIAVHKVDKTIDRHIHTAMFFSNPVIQEKTHAGDYLYSYEGDIDDKVEFYLLLANRTTLNAIRYGCATGKEKSDIRLMLERGVGDCFNIANCTYSNYVFMVTQTGNDRLLDNVRLVSGCADSLGIHVGHRWIERKFRDEWIPFETTRYSKEFFENIPVQKMNLLAKYLNSTDLGHKGEAKDEYTPYQYEMINSVRQYTSGIDWWDALLDVHEDYYIISSWINHN